MDCKDLSQTTLESPAKPASFKKDRLAACAGGGMLECFKLLPNSEWYHTCYTW